MTLFLKDVVVYIVYVSLLWLIISFAIAVAHSLCNSK